jgi:hypothetical protein
LIRRLSENKSSPAGSGRPQVGEAIDQQRPEPGGKNDRSARRRRASTPVEN